MDSWDVEFAPIDHLNPEAGYHLKVTRNGAVLLDTNRRPDTGADLTFHGCVEIAGFYGPKKEGL